MQRALVEIFTEVVKNPHVSERAKELAIEMMVGEITDGNLLKQQVLCVQLDCDYWIPVRNYQNIVIAVHGDEKIKAIKELRLGTRMGLKDAKDWVEFHWGQLKEEKL